jgi:hypothetical protein
MEHGEKRKESIHHLIATVKAWLLSVGACIKHPIV